MTLNNRTNIYVVVRYDTRREEKTFHICSAYPTAEEADNKAAAYNQLWKDKGWDDMGYFEVQLTTYYDE